VTLIAGATGILAGFPKTMPLTRRNPAEWSRRMNEIQALQLYAELQRNGVRANLNDMGRRGGAGPSDAKAFIFKSHVLTIPTLNDAARNSPYTIDDHNESVHIVRDGLRVETCRVVPTPRFYDRVTSDGIPFRKIATLHGSDCLASTVVQQCIRYANPEKRCHFCGIGVSLKSGNTIRRKTPEQLAEVAVSAAALDGVRHVTLTTGTTDERNKGAEYLGECARAIRDASSLPVHVQFEPPRDKEIFQDLRNMGVVNVGLHVESFDESARRCYTPGKSAIPLDEYFRAFEDAVAVFGRNNVNTFILLGLGEDESLTLKGCRRAAAMGVYPFLVPMRPMQGTHFATARPPSSAYVARMTQEVGRIIREEALSMTRSDAGCARCGACSLLQFTE
jgi:radical SAM protein (TIGR04043 family)